MLITMCYCYTFFFRSTPCPNVKHGEEWGEPGNCDAGDLCSYCHTRTEQQFHPEIYKSTKCNDVQQSGYCPRGVFCAFAHVERKLKQIVIVTLHEVHSNMFIYILTKNIYYTCINIRNKCLLNMIDSNKSFLKFLFIYELNYI